MTRARCFALALVVGVCCLGHVPAFAQYPPAAQPGPAMGYPGQPFETPEPLSTIPWEGDGVEPSINMVGPEAKISSWFLRAEYLNWNIGLSRQALLGAPVFGNHIEAPDKPFLVFAPNTQTVLGYGYVPNLNGINLNDNSGIQVTGGAELINGGTIEVSAFMLARKQSGYTIPLSTYGQFDPAALLYQQYGIGTGLPGSVGTIPFIALTSTLVNGSTANSHLFVYNQSFTATYYAQLWGGEVNYLVDGNPAEIFQWQPLIGARYLNLTESLNVVGVFNDLFNPGTITTTNIYSHAMNNLWGGQFGARLSVLTKYLEFGITPKLMLLGDTMAQTVSSDNFTAQDSGYAAYTSVNTKFTVGADVNAFVTVNLTPSFSIRTGYSMLWVNQVSRPYKNIYYND
ncbi:MAG: BBP7 family outer membrane beta-barrel protein, partial [Planctomycetes bacterium]|nr:BBP7 family outer membrane beta-barrel protein [Planctomycetota bacterium]